jgi:geranylgeranyl pyrophosphate synthase
VGFQLRDDLLNLTADSANEAPGPLAGGYGKEHGGDIAEGKRTLIVIELMERLPAPDAARVRDILVRSPEKITAEEIAWVIGQAAQSGALDAVRDRCGALARQARQGLAALPPSPQRDLLEELTGYLVLERRA